MGHNRCRSAGFPCLLLLLSLLQQRAYAAPVNTISTTNPAATSACDLPSSGDGKTTACFTGCRVCYFISADTDKQDRPCLCCKPGYALNTTDDVAQCDACSVGTYAPTAGCTECTACERGTTTTAKAARVCNACPRGTEFSTGSTKQGQLAAPLCRPCAANHYQPAVVLLSDSPQCIACAEGFRTAGANTAGNRTKCSRCKPGHGGAECQQCSSNTWSAGWAANNRTGHCKACAEGTEAPAGSTSKAACVAVASASPSPGPSPSPAPSPTPSPSPSVPTSPPPSPSPHLPSPSPPATPSPSPSPSPDSGNRPKPYIHLSVSSLIDLADGQTVAQWPNIGSTAATVPQATAAGTVLPVLRKTACGAPWVSLGAGADNSATNGGWFSLGSVDWHGAINRGYTFIGYVQFRGPHKKFERLFDCNEQLGTTSNGHVMSLMRTSSTERFYPSQYGWQWNRNTQSGPNLQSLNGTWHIIALRADTSSLTSYTSVVNTGGWDTTTIPTSPADYTTPYCYIGKATFGDAELANIDLRELRWYDEALSQVELESEIAAMRAAYPGPCHGYDCGVHGGCFEDAAHGCAAACACSEGFFGSRCETARSDGPGRHLLCSRTLNMV